jgi:hypothetical protein
LGNKGIIFSADNASANTAKNSMLEMQAVFDKRVINTGLRPLSQDMNVHDFYLWESYNRNVTKTMIHFLKPYRLKYGMSLYKSQRVNCNAYHRIRWASVKCASVLKDTILSKLL